MFTKLLTYLLNYLLTFAKQTESKHRVTRCHKAWCTQNTKSGSPQCSRTFLHASFQDYLCPFSTSIQNIDIHTIKQSWTDIENVHKLWQLLGLFSMILW